MPNHGRKYIPLRGRCFGSDEISNVSIFFEIRAQPIFHLQVNVTILDPRLLLGLLCSSHLERRQPSHPLRLLSFPPFFFFFFFSTLVIMMRSIKRTFSGNNLSKRRVRFVGVENSRSADWSDNNNNTTDGETGEGSTMGGDTISSASTTDTMSVVQNEQTASGCTAKGGNDDDGVDFEGVAIESIRAIGLSAWLVTETLMAVGSEIVRMQGSCGADNSMETSQDRTTNKNSFVLESDPNRNTPRRALSRLTGKDESGIDDDNSSIISNPLSKKKKRRKGRFAFFGALSNRTKRNFQAGLPPTTVVTTKTTTTTTGNTSELPSALSLQKKAPHKKPAPLCKGNEKGVMILQDPPSKIKTPSNRSRDHSPARAKKLLTGCFVKKHFDDDAMTQQSRYRTDHEDLELMGEQAVYTIRLSRVQTGEGVL